MERIERELIIKRAERCLEEEGYRISQGRGSFDILARKDFSIALKALLNVDSFTRSEAEDLKTMSAFLGTFPVLLGERANRYWLEESVVYERFGVTAMSSFTFRSFVRGVMPSAKSRRGGFSVTMDGRRLRSGLSEIGMSVNELASVSGISRKTLYRCGRGENADTKTCSMIERVIGTKVCRKIRMGEEFSPARTDPGSCFKRKVSDQLDRIGFSFSFLCRSPFNLIIKEEETLVSVASTDRKRMGDHSGVLRELESGFGLGPLFITGCGQERSVDGIPVVTLKEVIGMDSPREFIETVEERRD